MRFRLDPLSPNGVALIPPIAPVITGGNPVQSVAQATFTASGIVKQTVYNVRDYGAVGDGVTDDTAAIQALVNAMPTYGGDIYFPEGVYIITNTITIKCHGVYFIGATSASTYADQVNMQPGVRGKSVIQASISSFPASTPMLVWGELGTNKMWTGGGVNNMSILGTKGYITPGDGVQIINVQAGHIYDSIIGNVARGVYVASDQTGGTSNVNIDRNIIYGLASHGVYMDAGSDENYVRFNYIVNATGYAVAFNAGIGNTAIGNHINGTLLSGSGTADGTAFFIQGARSFVRDNDILTCASNGVYVGANKSQVAVTGNYIGNSNTANVANGAGVWVTGSGADILISDNNINDNGNKMVYGIRDTTTGGGVTIGPNAIRGYTTAKMISTNGSFQPLILPGKVGVGSITDPTASLSIAASSTAATSLNIASGTAPTSPNEGDEWNDSTQKVLVDYIDGIKQARPGVIFTGKATNSIGNVTSPTSVLPASFVGSTTLPANFFTAGKTIRIKIKGNYTTALTTTNATITVKLGSTTIATVTVTSIASATNLPFIGEIDISCYTTGVSGTVAIGGGVQFITGLTTMAFGDLSNGAATVTLDTTASKVVDVLANFGTSVATQDINTMTSTIEILN